MMRHETFVMTYLRIVRAPGLLTKAQTALGMSQVQMGHKLLGCSRRTMSRWVRGDNGPSIQQWATLAQAVYASDPALAAEIASEMGETLVSLRLEAPATVAASMATAGPPPRPAPPVSDLVDSVVCAAAEAIATTPQAIRPALLAAFDRTASVSLTMDDVRAALRPAPASATKKK
jgi:hypothetical protein